MAMDNSAGKFAISALMEFDLDHPVSISYLPSGLTIAPF